MLTMLNWADCVIIGIIGLSVLISLIRGFVREALSLIMWGIAFWIAITFSESLANLLGGIFHTPSLRSIAAFAILFVVTLLIGALVNYLIGQLVDKTGLSGTDRILGLVFGFARGVLVVTVMLMLARLTPLPEESWWKASVFIPHFHPVEVWLHNLLPQSVSQRLTLSY